MLVVMLGFAFFSASMLAGGNIGTSLNMSDFIKAVIFGNILLCIYTGLLAYIAGDTGLSTHLLARYSFGEKGSYLLSGLVSITQVGWFGVGVAMFAIPVSKGNRNKLMDFNHSIRITNDSNSILWNEVTYNFKYDSSTSNSNTW